MNYNKAKVAELLRDNQDLMIYMEDLVAEAYNSRMPKGFAPWFDEQISKFDDAFRVTQGQMLPSGDLKVISLTRIKDRKRFSIGDKVKYRTFDCTIEYMEKRSDGTLFIKGEFEHVSGNLVEINIKDLE